MGACGIVVALQDVATAAGVSKSVASRVLNGDPHARINPATAGRVRAAAERLNYVPNHHARALRAARAGAIALLVPEVNNPVFADLFTGVQEAANDSNVTVLVGETRGNSGSRQVLRRLVREGRIDGVILQRSEDMDDDTLRQTLELSAPTIVFNSRLPDRPGSVTLPDAPAMDLAVDHLVRLGHRRIGLIGGTEIHDAAQRRLAGFREAMTSRGLDLPADRAVSAGWEAPAGKSGMRQLMSAAEPPTAVVVASINAALGAMSTAQQAGLGVPDDLSIISIQDTWAAEIFLPALTVVRMPLERAGRLAATSLLAVLAGDTPIDLEVDDPAPELVVRSSTAPARTRRTS